MGARCWGCSVGVSPVGVDPAHLPLDPLGACWECGVFGCRGHAERDAGKGKWVCFASVATAVAASGGLDGEEPTPEEPLVPLLRFADSEDFERRFQGLADATREQREHFRRQASEGTLSDALHGLEIDPALVGDAVGIAMFLLPPSPERPTERYAEHAFAQASAEPSPIIPGQLGRIVQDLRDA
jgi:hypothetical protein